MKKLILLAVFWQTLNVSAYCHSGNPTASGVMPAAGQDGRKLYGPAGFV